MPTRLYLPSSGAPSVAPAFDLGWGVTTGADRVRTTRAKSGTLLLNKATAETAAAATDVLVRQYVSDPLAPQPIAGTVKAMLRCFESATAADMRAQIVIRLVSSTGTVRATLLARTTTALVAASEWATALAARKFPVGWTGAGAALTSATALAGDRLVIEIGYRAHNTVTTSRTGTLQFGDPLATGDLAETEATQSALCPWVEFSQNLERLYTPATHGRRGFTVTVTPDTESGATDRITVTGNLVEAAAAFCEIQDAMGTEVLDLAQHVDGIVVRQRSNGPLSTRVR